MLEIAMKKNVETKGFLFSLCFSPAETRLCSPARNDARVTRPSRDTPLQPRPERCTRDTAQETISRPRKSTESGAPVKFKL